MALASKYFVAVFLIAQFVSSYGSNVAHESGTDEYETGMAMAPELRTLLQSYYELDDNDIESGDGDAEDEPVSLNWMSLGFRGNKLACEACKLVMKAAKKWASRGDVKKHLMDECNHLHRLKSFCQKFVDHHLEEILRYAAEGGRACKIMHIC